MQVWDVKERNELCEENRGGECHLTSSRVNCLVPIRTENRILVGYADGTLKLYDLEDRKQLGKYMSGISLLLLPIAALRTSKEVGLTRILP